MTTDVTIYEPLAVMPILDIQGAMVRRQAMVDFVKTILVPDVDFGTIPGTDKPTLLKPGAEKLTTFFGLSKRFEIMEKVEDWTGANHGGEPFFYYLYRARLYRSEVLIAESDGSASSWESKYRYRWVGEFDVPAHLDRATLTKRGGKMTEFVFAIDKAETGGKYGKPSAYWKQFNDAIRDHTARPVKKTTSSGKSMDAWEIDSTVYRVPNPDPADVVNTIQKMSQKRALIAATLLAVNASEFFTQDMEDFIDVEYTMQTSAQPAAQPAPVVKVERPAPAGPTWTPSPQDAANDAAFETLPSASAERAGGNGKATPPANGAKHDPARAWDDDRKEEAVQWAMRRYPEVYGHIKPWRLSLDHLLEKAATEGMDAAQIAQAWKDKCADKQDELAAKKLQATLDAQAAGDELPVFESR